MNAKLTTDTVLASRYKIRQVIGNGGYSVTYTALDTHMDQIVAVKGLLVKDKAAEDIIREAHLLSHFRGNSYIVTVLDCFQENDTVYIVMEYLEGITLEAYVELQGPIPAEAMFRKILPVMEALQKVHHEGVIHRDITPANLMLMNDGSCKLIDFGSARSYLSDNGSKRVVTGLECLTPMCA